MTHLTPEKRLDKNGNLVTRHVKPPEAPTLGAFIPPPGSVTFASKVDGIRSLWASHRLSKMGMSLEDLDQNAVAEVERLLETFKGPGKNPKMGLQMSVSSALSLIETDGLHTELHNLAVFGKHIFPHSNVDMNQYVRTIHELTAPDEIDYLNGATDEQRASAIGLVSFIVQAESALEDKVIRYSTEDEYETFEFTELRDPKLTDFIWHNPDKVDDVLDILIQANDAVPIDVIKARLMHGEKALTGGVL